MDGNFYLHRCQSIQPGHRTPLQDAGVAYPPAITAQYLQLPADFSARVVATAISVTVGAITSFAKAQALETWLRTFPYNDAIPAPAAGVDPVEYFLYDIQQGYCDYYATALAVMLRSLHIPARLASGYAEGLYDEESDRYFVTDKNAHSWVEVFFPGLGWVEFEPTASISLPVRPTDANTALPEPIFDELDANVDPSTIPGGPPVELPPLRWSTPQVILASSSPPPTPGRIGSGFSPLGATRGIRASKQQS